MIPPRYWLHVLLLLSVALSTGFSQAKNLSCYQCIRHSEEECLPQDLKQCGSKHDRCVFHTSKSAQKGIVVKRECGLAPCGFDDEMVAKGLGMGGTCDRSKDEYFCFYCCSHDGCNKNVAGKVRFSSFILVSITVFSTIFI